MWWGYVETRPWPLCYHLSEPAPLHLHEPIGRQYQRTLNLKATTDEYWYTYAALRLRGVYRYRLPFVLWNQKHGVVSALGRPNIMVMLTLPQQPDMLIDEKA